MNPNSLFLLAPTAFSLWEPFQDGGRNQTTDTPYNFDSIYHDIIQFSAKTKDHIFETCKPLYEKGCSTREIERQTGISKTTVRETLQSRGYPLRSFRKDKSTAKFGHPIMRSGVIPYGYAYLDGQLIKNPSEYTVVNKIIKLWQSGKSLIAIAALLNDQRIPTRLGKKWAHSVVGAIVKRHQKSLEEKL